MAPTPSTASSRSLSTSQRKRTSQRNRDLPTTPTRHPQTRSLLTPQTRSASKRNASSSQNASKDTIDLSNEDSDADSNVPSLLSASTRETRAGFQYISSSSRNISFMELSDDSDTDVAATKQASKTSTLPVSDALRYFNEVAHHSEAC